MFDADTDTYTVYVPVEFSGTTPTKACMVQVGNDANGDIVVSIMHSDGMALTMIDRNVVLKNADGDCYIELNDDGGILNGNWKVTGAFDIGEVSLPLVMYEPTFIAWVLAVQTALNALGMPVSPPLTPTCATTMVKGF